MKPIWKRRLYDPGMTWTNVIGNGVEEDFHSPLVRGGDEFFVIVERAQMRIDSEEVNGAVAVVIIGRAVFHDWREPESCDAEILEIVEMIANATKIAAVPGTWFCAVVRAREFGGCVVGGISIGEAVRHDE